MVFRPSSAPFQSPVNTAPTNCATPLKTVLRSSNSGFIACTKLPMQPYAAPIATSHAPSTASNAPAMCFMASSGRKPDKAPIAKFLMTFIFALKKLPMAPAMLYATVWNPFRAFSASPLNMPLIINPTPWNAFTRLLAISMASPKIPRNAPFMPATTAFMPGSMALNALIIPFAVLAGKIFLMLSLNPCAALPQLPANAPVKNPNKASNAASPLPAAETIPSNADAIPPASILKALSISETCLVWRNQPSNIPARDLQMPPIFPAMLPTAFPIDANLFLKPSTESPAFPNTSSNQFPTPFRKPLT